MFKTAAVLDPLRWKALQPPLLTDHDNLVFDVLAVSNSELEARLEDAWRQHAPLALHDFCPARLCAQRSTVNDFKHQIVDCVLAAEARRPHQGVCDQWKDLPPRVRNHLLVPRNPVSGASSKASTSSATPQTMFHNTDNAFKEGRAFNISRSSSLWLLGPPCAPESVSPLRLGPSMVSHNQSVQEQRLVLQPFCEEHAMTFCFKYARTRDMLPRLLQESTTLTPSTPTTMTFRLYSPLEEWLAVGSSAADKAAIIANTKNSRSASFLDDLTAAHRYFRHWRNVCDSLEAIYTSFLASTWADGTGPHAIALEQTSCRYIGAELWLRVWRGIPQTSCKVLVAGSLPLVASAMNSN